MKSEEGYQLASFCLPVFIITAPFNNTRTLKFKARPTFAFFAAVNQMFGCASQLPSTAERAVVKFVEHSSDNKHCSSVVGSRE